MILVLETIFCF